MAKDDKIEHIHNKLDDVAATCAHIDKELALHKAAFDTHIKQDELMYEEFKRMNDILQQNTDSLKEHIRRTDLLENIVEKMDARFTPIELEHIRKAAVKSFILDKSKFIAKVAGAIVAAGGAWMLLKPYILLLLQ